MNVFKSIVRSARRLVHDIGIEIDAQRVARGNAVFRRRAAELDGLTPEQHNELRADTDAILKRSAELLRTKYRKRS